jgi:hypothetical protein
MGKKKIPVGAWAYIRGGYEDDPIRLPTVAKKLQEMNFDGVELAAFRLYRVHKMEPGHLP